jgi:hypothetical protein
LVSAKDCITPGIASLAKPGVENITDSSIADFAGVSRIFLHEIAKTEIIRNIEIFKNIVFI